MKMTKKQEAIYGAIYAFLRPHGIPPWAVEDVWESVYRGEKVVNFRVNMSIPHPSNARKRPTAV
jgi:hypothetical protein